MSDGLTMLMLALVALQLKHFVCDFLLQTPYQLRNKGTYGHPGGILHAGIHAVGTLPALFILGAGPGMIAAVIVAEFVVHYHADWGKEQFGRRMKLTPANALFWQALGFDQLVHQLTYVAIVWIVAT